MSMRCAGLLFATALASCAGPPVRTATVPPVAPPPAWRTDAGPIAPIDRTWWQSFGDPTMAALIDKALAHNNDIAIAMGRVREAQANLALARAQLLPTIDAGLSGGRSRSVSPFGMPSEQNAAGVRSTERTSPSASGGT